MCRDPVRVVIQRCRRATATAEAVAIGRAEVDATAGELLDQVVAEVDLALVGLGGLQTQNVGRGTVDDQLDAGVGTLRGTHGSSCSFGSCPRPFTAARGRLSCADHTRVDVRANQEVIASKHDDRLPRQLVWRLACHFGC